MFYNAQHKKIEYPSHLISPELADLLKLMLDKDPYKRITKGETDKIKRHPWCYDIDWDAVYQRKVEPPHVPSITRSNFDPEYVRETSMMTSKGNTGASLASGRVTPTGMHSRDRSIRVNRSMASFNSYYYLENSNLETLSNGDDQTNVVVDNYLRPPAEKGKVKPPLPLPKSNS